MELHGEIRDWRLLGGAFRNHSGEWCGGFAINIGITTAPTTELWGVVFGLEIAWDKGLRRVHVEIDSKVVLRFIEKGVQPTHPLASLVLRCQDLLTRDLVVRFGHVFREGNRVADSLANVAFSLSLGLHLFDFPPPASCSIVLDDVRGISFPRMMLA